MKILYSTKNYEYLANELLKEDGNQFIQGQVERKTFPDGENYLRVQDNVTGSHCTILAGTICDGDTLELFDLGSTLVNMGAKKLTILIPYYGYSTMERGSKSGEAIKAKTRANLIASIPKAAYGNDIKIIELHNEAVAYYFNETPAQNISSKSVIMKACVELAGTEFVLATTDVGRAKAVEYIQRAFNEKHREYNIETAYAYKRRDSGTDTEITGINADVKGKIVVIYDDLFRTGGSLIKAVKIYKEHGASTIHVIITHGIFVADGISKLVNSKLVDSLAVTNSHPNAISVAKQYPEFIRLYSISGLLNRYS